MAQLVSSTFSYNYDWRQSRDDPSVYTRRAFGMEVLCDLMPRIDPYRTHGNAVIAVQTKMSGNNALQVEELYERVRLAWELTRLEIPTIAAVISADQDGWTQLTYRVPQNREDMRNWSGQTVFLAKGSIFEARNHIGGNILPNGEGYQGFIHVSPDEDLQGFGVLLHGYHTASDMAGGLMIIDCLLAKLAGILEEGDFNLKARTLPFGSEVEKLLPACNHNLLPKDQFDDGLLIEERIMKCARLMKNIPRDPGLDSSTKASHQTFKYYFDRAESQRILQAIKKTKFTVNQIAHAAIVLVILQSNPPDKNIGDEEKMFFSLPVNLRRLLKPPYAGIKNYPGFCILSTPIEIPLSICKTIDSLDKPSRGDLLAIAEILKKEYSRTTRMQDGLITFSTAIQRMISEQGLSNPNYRYKTDHLHRPPLTQLTSRFQTYSGDGPGETFLQPEYCDSRRKAVINIVDHFVSINMSGDIPGFRLHSWRGQLHLIGNFNDRSLDKSAMRSFLENWAKCIRLVQSTNGEHFENQINSKL